MLHLLVALLLLALITVELLHAVQARKKLRLETATLFLTRFRALAKLYGLRFSSQEFFGSAAMGFDGVQRKLLILIGNSETNASYHLIDLRQITSCRVLKEYRRTVAAEGRPQKQEQYLYTISLCFELRAFVEPIEVVFYQHTAGKMRRLEMEQKAKRWEAILSKMHNGPAREMRAGLGGEKKL